MINWIKGKLRTRKALLALKRDIDVLRIHTGCRRMLSISDISRGYGYSDVVDKDNARKLINLCKHYLIVKRIGADAAVLHKLGGGA